jgi:thiosulfate reductase cytochrome b subunit
MENELLSLFMRKSTMRIAPKHPLAIRWCHWINFPLLFVMIWSGILILWANPAYPTPQWRVNVPDSILVYFWGVTALYDGAEVPKTVPASRYEIAIGSRLAEGMAWHFTFAWLFVLNGIVYVLYLLRSKEWKHLLPRRESLVEAGKVVLHDLRLYKKPLPPGKFNHAQRIAYTTVIVLSALLVVTGVAIYKPAQLAWLIALLGGYQAARTEHFLLTGAVLLFFLVHVVQVMRAGWNNFRAMITGWEVVKEGEKKDGEE